MSRREARRIAIRNIVDGIRGDIASGASYWLTHPHGGRELTSEEAVKVEDEAKTVLAVLELRALPPGTRRP